MSAITRAEGTEEDANDIGGEEYVRDGTVTGHVRSGNRLNVALTRGEGATLVLCQAALLVSTTRKNRSRQFNVIAHMVGNAKERNCLLENSTEDSHPASVAKGEEMGKKRVEAERNAKRIKTLEFMVEGKNIWQHMKNMGAISENVPFQQYRTQGGHITRPIGKLGARADAYEVWKAEKDQVKAAMLASIATEMARTEEQRALALGVRLSLGASGFPPLPPPLRSMETAEPAMDTTAEDSDGDHTSLDTSEEGLLPISRSLQNTIQLIITALSFKSPLVNLSVPFERVECIAEIKNKRL